VRPLSPHIQNYAYDSNIGHIAPDNSDVPNTTLSNILSFGEDAGTGFAYRGSSNGTGKCAGLCRPGFYANLSEARPDLHGDDDNPPFESARSNNGLGGSCPSTAPRLFASGVFQESDFYHAAGTSVASENRIASATEGHYVWFWNKGSDRLLNFVNGVLQNCKSTNDAIYDDYKFLFADNTDFPMSRGNADFGAYFPGIPGALKNIGSANGQLVSAKCAFYDGSPHCTQAGSIRSSSTTSTLETATDSDYNRDISKLYCNLKHRDGSIFFVIFNGAKFNYVPTRCPAVLGGLAEGLPYENVLASHPHLAQALDAASGYCSTTSPPQSWGALSIGSMGNADAGPNTASGPFGSARQQTAMRIQMAFAYLSMSTCSPNRTLDWADIEAGQKPRASEWPYQFLVPTSSTVRMVSGARGVHGANDLCISGTYPNCVYAVTFRYCWWQPHYGSAKPGFNVGPCAAELNLSGSARPVVDTDFFGVPAHTFTHFITPCTSTAASYFAYVADPACSGNTAGDVMTAGTSGTGPGTLKAAFSYAPGTYTLANNDAIVLVNSQAF